MTKAAKAPRKSEIAAVLGQKINAHLKRIESDPVLNPGRRLDKEQKTWVLDERGTRAFYGAGSAGDRHRVRVLYVTYQSTSYLAIEEAEKYLAWLDAGNVGRHVEALREMSK
jgi:hypothetical protein